MSNHQHPSSRPSLNTQRPLDANPVEPSVLLHPSTRLRQTNAAPRNAHSSNLTSAATRSSRDYHPPLPAPRPSHSPSSSSRRSRSLRRPGKSRPNAIALPHKQAMTGMLDIDYQRSRRDRSFVGGKCIFCDELLEHTLRGERILQLACSHISHEACFYEYIRSIDNQRCPDCDAVLGLDSSRGGNVLDIEKLSAIVRALQTDADDARPRTATVLDAPSATNTRTQKSIPTKIFSHSARAGAPSPPPPRADSAMADSIALASPAQIPPLPMQRSNHGSRPAHADVEVRMGMVKSPIPPPILTIRSEYVTITRARGQQSLTCLITIHVPEGQWTPNPQDLRGFATASPQDASEVAAEQSLPNDEDAEHHAEVREELEDATHELLARVDNWHGLDFSRFGKLKLYGTFHVGKDKLSWQELECYLFAEMLICVREKRNALSPNLDEAESLQGPTKCSLKGSIMIKRHLRRLEESAADDDCVLTLKLTVAELPAFHLRFPDRKQLELWKKTLVALNTKENSEKVSTYESVPDEYDYQSSRPKLSSVNSSYGGVQFMNNTPSEHSDRRSLVLESLPRGSSLHVPVDVVVLIPISASMHGLKITLLRDMLRFLVSGLGDSDRIGVITFGSEGGAILLTGLETKEWPDWEKVADSIRAIGQKSPRADLVEGSTAAMDLLMQRRVMNPLACIMIINDSSTSESESIDFVVSRAEAAKVPIFCFGLGLTHRADAMIELSSRTKASYTYVKDWMMLRECVGGCLGSLQSTSHQNVRLVLRLPEGSPAKFAKISGALQVTQRSSGRDAEAALGDLRFGEKRDVLVQLAVQSPENGISEGLAQDPWDTIVSGLQALGGPVDTENTRTSSIEEAPMLQADLLYGDILRNGMAMHLPRPSLLAVTVLPGSSGRGGRTAATVASFSGRPATPPIPPHGSIVQRRMELLTSDMLTRALSLVAVGQHERAQTLLRETRSILRGLGKGRLPPLPGSPSPMPGKVPPPLQGPWPGPGVTHAHAVAHVHAYPHRSISSTISDVSAAPSDATSTALAFAPHAAVQVSGLDPTIMAALDAELEASLEWIAHPAVFGRDSRKAVLQAIGVIGSQRAYTFRTQLESLWAIRVPGTRQAIDRSRAWRDAGGGEVLLEES